MTKIWTVLVVGDGEVNSAWITENLAWSNAVDLASRISQRAKANKLHEAVRTYNTPHGLVVEVALNLDLEGEPMWSHHKTIRVGEIEVLGDAITALAKVAK